MRKILIIGGASAIASETAKLFAKKGDHLFLADLNIDRLNIVRDDISTFHPAVIHLQEFNVLNFDRHNELFNRAIEALGGLDIVLIAHGTLPDQKQIESNSEHIIREFNINCVSVISLASIAATHFENQGSGSIAVISSVAGDRGRQSNYIYGSAKGGVSLFLQGLRNRLNSKGVSVLTIKPGFVDTPMTAGMPKNALYSSPAVIGKGISDAIDNKKDIVYLPGFWRLVMFIIKHIPEGIFKKLKL